MSGDPNADGSESAGSPVVRVLQRVTPDPIRRRFALKFALVLVVMGAILLGLGVTATDALSTQVEDDTRLEYERLANQQASLVETWLERSVSSVKLASQNQALTEELSDDSSIRLMNNQLNRPFAALYGARSVSIVTTADVEDPTIVASPRLGTGRLPVSVTDADKPWLAEVDLDEMNTREVRMSSVYMAGETPVVGLVTPVEGPTQRFLVMEFEVSDLTEAISDEGLGNARQSQFTQIVDADRSVQADTRMLDDRDADILGTYPNEDTVTRALADSDDEIRTSGVSIVEDDPTLLGESYAVGYASVEVEDVDPGWAVVTHASTNELFGFVQTISRLGIGVTALAALLIGLVGATMGYSTANAIDRLRGKVEEMEAGNLDVAIHSTRIDSIGRLYGGFASMRDALRNQINEAEQARKEAEVARAEAMEMNEYLQNKAEEYSETMRRCAGGDLTQRLDPDGENDAMDQIATDFNEMIEELEGTTGQLKHFADEVEEAGDVVETSAESVRDASEQVAESIQRISDDAYDQQERLERLSASIDEAIDQFERVAAEADIDISESVEQLRAVAETINDLVDLTDEMMAESENVAGAAEEQAAELNAVSQQARDLTRYARPLRDVLESFETEEEHEFYFPTGPGSPQADDS